ncbi:hypothetical protein IAR55_002646 [Kwoniella newhampshirensis]|uniref:Uncharacterized protein n=1 Tax=Kwoniella newhampshirensis TaxID=1651941 RepID=A0AAW0YZ64_9TREE
MTRSVHFIAILLGLTLLALLNVNAVALPTEALLQDRAGPAEWPEQGHAAKRRQAPTNANRIKRGMSPLPPKKRSPTATHQLVPRLSPAPGASSQFGYNFRQCTDSFDTLAAGPTITADNVQSAVDQCATSANNGLYENFGIRYLGFNSYSCQLGLSSVNNVPCDDDNFGFYSQPT